eukprot:180180_1
MKIAIVHLDLGQGGAERQTIDEAIALKANGHDVTIYTAHHDRKRAFDETTDANILGNNIEVYGDWIPRHIFHKFHALMSIYRMLWCSLRVLWSNNKYDIIFIDQVSAAIPFLKLQNTKVVYYCHHPDLLLVQNKNKSSFLKQKYRTIIDWFEAITTINCDELLVNSKYTKTIVLNTFPFLKQMPFLQPKVVYPAININQCQSIYSYHKQNNNKWINKRITFLSINRYERKKQIHLAIKALNKLFINLGGISTNKTSHIKLIIAGGYDERVIENKEYFNELIEFCKQMKLKYQFINPEMLDAMDEKKEKKDENILFLDNENINESVAIYFVTKFPDSQKEELLKECCCVLYTPENEHFGIVPIEGMLAMRPVIAHKSGGPLETIINGQNGFLCGNNEQEWANAMMKFVENKELILKMGQKGKQRVIDNFSRKELVNVMDRVVKDVKDKKFKLPMIIKMQTWFIIGVLLWTFVSVTPLLFAVTKIQSYV